MKNVIEYRVPVIAEREATIQLSDTFSDVPAKPGTPPIADFDSLLTAQVRNTGRWTDFQSPIGGWPQTGSYAGVLISELRTEQRRLLDIYEDADKSYFPDAEVLAESLGRSVIGVINWAPRTKQHYAEEKNGEDFYLAELDNNVQLFSQLPFLSGVAARGLVSALWRIRDDNEVWPRGEQFRSSIVSQLRNFPEHLEQQPLDILPATHSETLSLVYADKYGNCRLEKPAGIMIDSIAGRELNLSVNGHRLKVYGVNRLTEIPEDQLGVYFNPADDTPPDAPHYIELARRVSDPNNPARSAYETLRQTVSSEFDSHPNWQTIEITLTDL